MPMFRVAGRPTSGSQNSFASNRSGVPFPLAPPDLRDESRFSASRLRGCPPSSRVLDEVRFVAQIGGELLDVEGPVESGVQLLRVDEEADFNGLAGKEASDEWIEATHDCPLYSGAA